MANDFSTQNNASGFDYLTAGTQPSERGVAPALKNTLRLYDQKGDPSWMGRGEIVLHDLSQQGLNHPEGPFTHNSNGFMASNMITDEPNSMIPPPEPDLDAAPIVSGTIVGQHSAYVFGTLVVGAGGGANVSLWKPTSATDATPSAITYTPSASICSLTAVVDDGVPMLLVGRIGAAAQLHSDAAGTVATTMHTDTNSLWGCILSDKNATDAGVPVMLLYAGTSIKTKATNADLTTATVATTPATTVRAGGFAIGKIKPKGRAQRAFWAIPHATNTAGALKFGAEALMGIYSTDMLGNDLQPLTLRYLPEGILGAVPWRDGLVAFNTNHVIYWDGDDEYDLGIFRRRIGIGAETFNYNTLSSDIKRRVRAVLARGPNLYALTNPYDIGGDETAKYILEKYKYESGVWSAASPAIGSTSNSSAAESYLCGTGGMPFSPETNRVYFYETGSVGADPRGWFQLFIPPAGESILWQHSQGSGSSTTNIPTFYTGKVLLPNWWIDETPPGALPGSRSIERAPKVITEVEFLGNLDYGGDAIWTLRAQCFGIGMNGDDGTPLTAYDQTFSQGKPVADYKRRNPLNARGNIQNMQWFFTATPASSTRKAPELLPIIIRFAYSKDGRAFKELPEDMRS